MKNHSIKRYLSLLLAVTVLLGGFNLGLTKEAFAKEDKAGDTANEKVISKDLRKELDKGTKFHDVMILFKEEASIEEAKKVSDSFNTDDSQAEKEAKAYIGDMKETSYRTQASLVKWLKEEKKKNNVRKIKSFFIVNSMNLVATKEVIERISENPKVKYIDVNATIKQDEPIKEPTRNRQKRMALPAPSGQVEWNIKKIGADSAWKNLNITGKGITVGIFDSSINLSHPALKKKFKGYNENTGNFNYTGTYFDAVDNKTKPNPKSENSHGSHCMGIILGSEDGPGGQAKNRIGVAPDAKFISARVFGDNGESTTEGFLDAAQWMLAPNGKFENAPQIINNSWGGAASNNNSPWFKAAVDSWRNAGILPVFASGNWSPGEPAPGERSISTPGAYLSALAVGAVDHKDQLAVFSKRGPSFWGTGKDWKPELVAPGVTIRSSVGNAYEYMTGTSMAAPHVSGAAALVKSADTALSVQQVQDILEKTATPLTDSTYKESPNHGYGYGLVNAYNAVSEATGKGNGQVIGKVTGENENPLKAEVRIKETDKQVSTDGETGEFALSHPAGEWTLVVSSYGYETKEVSVTITKDNKLEQNINLAKKEHATLKLNIESDDHKPIDGAFVRILEDSNVTFKKISSGKYESTSIPAGNYTLRVYKEGYTLKEIKVSVPRNESVNVVLDTEVGISEQEISYHTGEHNRKPEENFIVGRNGYKGGVVRFVPSKKGGSINSIAVQIARRSYFCQGNKGKLSIMQRDDEGRLISLVDDIIFDFEYGEVKTIYLGKYNLKTDKPFYAVITSAENSVFAIGVSQNGDKDYSYIYNDNNLYPIENEVVYGSLMVSASMHYPTNGEDIVYNVEEPMLDPIYPKEKAVSGKAKPNQIVQLVLQNTLRFNDNTDGEGRFTFDLKAKLKPGEEVKCYAKDENGIKSKAAVGIVLTDDTGLTSLIKKGDKVVKENANLDTTELKSKLKEAKDLLATITEYQKGTVDKDTIKKHQNSINRLEKDIKQIIIKLTPEKERLYEAIQKAKKHRDEAWISQDGRDVPNTKDYVSSSAWTRFNNSILEAMSVYGDTSVDEARINRAIERLKDASLFFDSAKKKGLEEVLVIDSKYRDGTFEGEGRGQGLEANHVIVTIKDGKIIDLKIKEWSDSPESYDAIMKGRFLDRIVENNALDVKRITGYEIECQAIIKAIHQAVEKALKEGEVPDTDRTPLKNAISEAKEVLASVKVSKDGKDIPEGESWVAQRDHDDLKKAIENAEAVLAKEILTIDQRSKAITLLTIAKHNFISSRKIGVHEAEEIGELRDGEYTADAIGKNKNGKNTFKIVIEGGKIKSVEIVKWEDTPGYDTMLKKGGIFDAIVKGNTHQVDAVTNATESSKSVREAVEKALKEAAKKNVNEEVDIEKVEAEVNNLFTNAKKLMFETKVKGSKVKLRNRKFEVSKKDKDVFMREINAIVKGKKDDQSVAKMKKAIQTFKEKRKKL